MKKYRLHDIAAVIRSKNSGPYELTFDILMKDDETFEKVASADIFSKKLISELYNLPEDDIQSIIKFPKEGHLRLQLKGRYRQVPWATGIYTEHSSMHH